MKKLIWLALLLPFAAQAHCPDCEERIQALEEVVYSKHPVYDPVIHGDRIMDALPPDCRSGQDWGEFEGEPWYPNGLSFYSGDQHHLTEGVNYLRILVAGNNDNRLQVVMTDGSIKPLANFLNIWEADNCRYYLVDLGLI